MEALLKYNFMYIYVYDYEGEWKMNLEQTERKQISENYFIIEENLMLLHSMSENLRIVSSGISDENPSLEKALYGISRVIEGQINEIEDKLLQIEGKENGKAKANRMNL